MQLHFRIMLPHTPYHTIYFLKLSFSQTYEHYNLRNHIHNGIRKPPTLVTTTLNINTLPETNVRNYVQGFKFKNENDD